MHLTDLSVGGCFVSTRDVLLAGSRVTLQVMVSGVEVGLTGRVVHAEPGRGFGFVIDAESLDQSRKALEEFLLYQGS